MNKTLARLYDEAGIEPDNLEHVKNAILINEQKVQDIKYEISKNFYTDFLEIVYDCKFISKEEYDYFKTTKEDEIYGGLLGILSSKKFSVKGSSSEEEKQHDELLDIFIDELHVLENTRMNKANENWLQKMKNKLSLYMELYQAEKENRVLCKRRKQLINKSKKDN